MLNNQFPTWNYISTILFYIQLLSRNSIDKKYLPDNNRPEIILYVRYYLKTEQQITIIGRALMTKHF